MGDGEVGRQGTLQKISQEKQRTTRQLQAELLTLPARKIKSMRSFYPPKRPKRSTWSEAQTRKVVLYS